MKGSLRHILVVALAATIALVASGATRAATHQICKPSTAKQCRCRSKLARRTARCNKKPIARFTFTPAPSGSPSHFDARASRDPDGKIVRYSWSFGGTGATTSHTWDAAGTYQVTLVVKDNRGATAKVTKSVVIPQSNQQPIASFTFSPAPVGSPSDFDASASHDPDGEIAAYSWSFGATGVAASHTWDASGTYQVALTVTDDHGATATVTKSVVIPAAAPPPGVTLTMGSDMPDPPASAIRNGFEIATRYLPALGAPTDWHADVYAEATFDEIVADVGRVTGSDQFARDQCPNGCAFVLQRSNVFIFPFGSSFPRPDETAFQTRVPVHELWHTVQYALAPQMDQRGADGLFLDGPTWLREGSADYVGYIALRDNGVDVSPLRASALYDIRNRYADVTLASTASGQGNGAA